MTPEEELAAADFDNADIPVVIPPEWRDEFEEDE
jgi:hypothetical protein